MPIHTGGESVEWRRAQSTLLAFSFRYAVVVLLHFMTKKCLSQYRTSSDLSIEDSSFKYYAVRGPTSRLISSREDPSSTFERFRVLSSLSTSLELPVCHDMTTSRRRRASTTVSRLYSWSLDKILPWYRTFLLCVSEIIYQLLRRTRDCIDD